MRNFGMLALANARGLKDPAALRYIDNGGGGVIAISGQRDATTYNAGYAGVSFITDEDLIAIDCGSGASPIPYVDGVRVIPGMIGSAASRYKYLTFANRRMRRIRFSSTDSINEIYVKTATTAAALVLQPDTAAMSFDTLWVGDSYTAGAAPGPSDRDAGWANLTAKELGIPAPVMCATGGTGWMTAAGVYDYLQRLTADLAYHAARNYDLIVLTGSGNDLSGALADNAAYRTQVQTILALCRSFAPNAYIAVTGINNGDFNTLGAAATLNTMLSQEVATFAAADTNRTFFIPFSQDMPGAVPFFNLVNKAYYIGTTDQHPFDSGHYAMAKYTADRIRGFAGV
jgi:lysophospholipase L1-like esterase